MALFEVHFFVFISSVPLEIVRLRIKESRANSVIESQSYSVEAYIFSVLHYSRMLNLHVFEPSVLHFDPSLDRQIALIFNFASLVRIKSSEDTTETLQVAESSGMAAQDVDLIPSNPLKTILNFRDVGRTINLLQKKVSEFLL